MIIELILALVVGIIVGIFTGLIPGLHINLVGAFLISSVAVSYNMQFIVFIVAMSITHTFLDFIPSIFIGAPEEETSLSVLPGHELLKQGKGYEAVYYTAVGGVIGVLIILLFTPIFLFALPRIEAYLKNVMFLILITASLFLFFKNRSVAWAAIVFIMAGFLGIATLNLGVREPLLPLFSGLFGVPAILLSIKNKAKIPKQRITKPAIQFKTFKRPILATLLSSPLCSFLPSLGSSQAAVIGSDLVNTSSRKEFLFLIGSINTIIVGLSFITLLSIDKSRTGVAAFLKPALQSLQFNYIIFIILAVVIISGIISFFITLKLARFIALKIHNINYAYISVATLLFVIALTFFISSFLGIIVLAVATFLGLFTISINVNRNQLLGCLMIPTILFYLPFF